MRRFESGAVDEEGKAALRKLKKNRAMYVLKILELKHNQTKYSHQKNECCMMIQRLVVMSRLKERQRMVALDEPGFLAYQKFYRNKTDAGAQEEWERMKASADTRQEPGPGKWEGSSFSPLPPPRPCLVSWGEGRAWPLTDPLPLPPSPPPFSREPPVATHCPFSCVWPFRNGKMGESSFANGWKMGEPVFPNGWKIGEQGECFIL